MNIGYIGNFEAQYSTENDRAWAFNKLGHNVIAFQENPSVGDDIIKKMIDIDLLVYSHTHGWEIPGLETIFDIARAIGVPVISVHLDRWAGLARETDVGKEATWKVDHLFMADGSPEAVELYEKNGVNNWSYLKPGVDERGCYMAQPDPVRFPHEIIFVGSKNYHPEYPFRPKLVEFLHKTYGDRFAHYGGDGLGTMRGHDLNVLYASAKVVVGDSCFGGRPHYWSDRVTETLGRGGFLLHPKIHDLPFNLMGNYTAGDLNDVKAKVDMYLKYENDRKKIQLAGFTHVKKYETYTNRAQEILNVINDKH